MIPNPLLVRYLGFQVFLSCRDEDPDPVRSEVILSWIQSKIYNYLNLIFSIQVQKHEEKSNLYMDIPMN